ncbi:Alpha/Beta hydrolase protein [Biscogniauxia sp. FL1348]|nr:Alpha/Beta hydrolase protein [Biscogniauxia sp. FL1348]
MAPDICIYIHLPCPSGKETPPSAYLYHCSNFKLQTIITHLAMVDSTADAQVDDATQKALPLLSRLRTGAIAYTLKAALGGIRQLANLRGYFCPAECQPDTVKSYSCRPGLHISVYYPKTYDQGSSEPLPTLFNIHGGGFCIGDPSDDNELNAQFASLNNVLVIALNYRKAPQHPFPTAVYDLEALMLAAFNDDTLPIDKTRTAVGGYSAGGSLALSVCQLRSIRETVKPAAALPVYAIVEHTTPLETKYTLRRYKPGLGPGKRSGPTDMLAFIADVFEWAYVPLGQDLRDPLLSPYFAARSALPPHVFFVASELDMLSHETWRMASRFAGRPVVPTFADKVGQAEPASKPGELIFDDERFAFGQVGEGGRSSVRWLLVPDQIHGFDRRQLSLHGSEEAMHDAQLKTEAYQKAQGEWLHQVAWKTR